MARAGGGILASRARSTPGRAPVWGDTPVDGGPVTTFDRVLSAESGTDPGVAAPPRSVARSPARIRTDEKEVPNINTFLTEVRETLAPGRRRPFGPLPPLLVAMTVLTGLVDSFSYLIWVTCSSPT